MSLFVPTHQLTSEYFDNCRLTSHVVVVVVLVCCVNNMHSIVHSFSHSFTYSSEWIAEEHIYLSVGRSVNRKKKPHLLYTTHTHNKYNRKVCYKPNFFKFVCCCCLWVLSIASLCLCIHIHMYLCSYNCGKYLEEKVNSYEKMSSNRFTMASQEALLWKLERYYNAK